MRDIVYIHVLTLANSNVQITAHIHVKLRVVPDVTIHVLMGVQIVAMNVIHHARHMHMVVTHVMVVDSVVALLYVRLIVIVTVSEKDVVVCVVSTTQVHVKQIVD